jgi:hypothetical protein
MPQTHSCAYLLEIIEKVIAYTSEKIEIKQPGTRDGVSVKHSFGPYALT